MFLGEFPRFGRMFAVPINLLVLAISVANIFVWQTAAAYVIGVLLLVVAASGMFLNLIFRFFQPTRMVLAALFFRWGNPAISHSVA